MLYICIIFFIINVGLGLAVRNLLIKVEKYEDVTLPDKILTEYFESYTRFTKAP